MGPTVFAAIESGDRSAISMKDTRLTVRLDPALYGWPKTLGPDGVNDLAVGGFAFSEVDAYPPKMYFGTGNELCYVHFPSNGARTPIRSGYASNPMHIDVQNTGGQDVINFCTIAGFYKYNFSTVAEKKLLTFNNEDWNIESNDDIAVCYRFRSKNRIIVISRDKVGVWVRVSGNWIPLFTPKKRYWYPYKVRMVEFGNDGHFILYAKNAFMVLDSANLDTVHVWNREWDWADWGT